MFFLTDNSAPVVSAPATVNVQLNQEVVFYVTAIDAENADVTIELINAIDGATFNAATGEFRWTVASADVVEIA